MNQGNSRGEWGGPGLNEGGPGVNKSGPGGE